MDNADLAYTAGIVDGEGCIGLYPSHNSLVVRVTVNNTNEWLMQWLKSNFRGSVYYKPLRKKNHKPVGCWTLETSQALEFLKLIYPYLRLKRPQAELAFKFYEQSFRRQGHVLLQEEKEILEAMKTAMHILNKRGV